MMSQTKDKVSQFPTQTSKAYRANSIPLPPGQPRNNSRHNTSLSENSSLQDSTDFNTLQPIDNDPSQVMEEIEKISTSLLDISLKGFTVFKRCLEYFAQLSEKMLQLIRTQNTRPLATTRIAISMLREKIEDFTNLLAQINTSPSYDENRQIETFVNDISKSCRDLYYESLYSNK